MRTTPIMTKMMRKTMMWMKSHAEVKSQARSDVCRFSLELKQYTAQQKSFSNENLTLTFLKALNCQYMSSFQELKHFEQCKIEFLKLPIWSMIKIQICAPCRPVKSVSYSSILEVNISILLRECIDNMT